MQNFQGIRIKDERENDRNLLVEFSFEAPLTADLAEEICPAWVPELFSENGRDWTPRPEFSKVTTSLAPKRQIVTLRANPDLPEFAREIGVGVKNVVVKKAAKLEAWVLSWTMTFPLTDHLTLGLIQMIRRGVYMTCELMDPKLFPEEADDDVVEAGADEGGVGKTARRRGRPKSDKAPKGKRGKKGASKEVDQKLPDIEVQPERPALQPGGDASDTRIQ